MNLSIIIPSKNEAASLVTLLPKLKSLYPSDEIILVNDGSTDNTSEICKENNVIEVKHPYSKGNGAAIKSGARAATGDVLVFMDADGQHEPEDIVKLTAKIEEGFDLVVGSRGRDSQASAGRYLANSFYNWFSSWMVGQKVMDLTSGFRAVIRSKFIRFLYMLPNGFSYPTTSTMAFFRAGYSVCYVPIKVKERIGTSHIKLFKDGFRFLLIIFKIGTLYSPLKLFFPVCASLFFLGLSYYGYTYVSAGRFTNMSALLFISSLLFFALGLISEQVSNLQYMKQDD
ncbi:glycosyltransferase family 2 protein [Hahella ganghwensis]|uniref:glycosyltransferase family 2 protein n=1 Tax=Hahella ganghwensis TaxID=286420 RepID=UPI000367D6C1|nr:glycosyltransferase family 2 protein [Hahella ganghwensis]